MTAEVLSFIRAWHLEVLCLQLGWVFPLSNLINLEKCIMCHLHTSLLIQTEYTEHGGIDWMVGFWSIISHKEFETTGKQKPRNAIVGYKCM